MELSVAVGERISRWQLWLGFHDLGCDPETLTQQDAVAFCGAPLAHFLREHRLRLSGRAQRRLRRAVRRYDPSFPTPEERLAEF